MAGVRVKLDSGGMESVLKSDQVMAVLRAEAEAIAARAVASAPVASGEYKGSIRVATGTTDRAVARVIADAPHALVVEAKTGNLARALRG